MKKLSVTAEILCIWFSLPFHFSMFDYICIHLTYASATCTRAYLQTDLAQNGDIAEDDTLKNLWQWLYLSRSLVEAGTIQSLDNKHPGVR